MKAALYSLLTTTAGVTQLVGDRVYPEIIPEQIFDAASQRPCIVYRRQSVERERTLCSTDSKVQSTFALDCYARTAAGAEDVAQAVRVALTDFTGTVAGVSVVDTALIGDSDFLDIEPGLFRVMLTFRFWHSETL